MDDKALSRDKHQADSYLLAEGLMDGKVVATHRVMPARRASRIKLWVDNEGTEMKADGSDIVTVVAAVTDDNGTIKRLNNEQIRFDIEGPGRLLADELSFTNPRAVQWGTVLYWCSLPPCLEPSISEHLWYGKAKLHRLMVR